jgi:hypothetical protein
MDEAFRYSLPTGYPPHNHGFPDIEKPGRWRETIDRAFSRLVSPVYFSSTIFRVSECPSALSR